MQPPRLPGRAPNHTTHTATPQLALTTFDTSYELQRASSTALSLSSSCSECRRATATNSPWPRSDFTVGAETNGCQ